MTPEPSIAASNASLDELCINALRFLSVDAVQKANSGHPGLPLGAAAMAYVLWTRFLKHHPANPDWFDRDRFVLSAGHGSMLLYSLLHVTGYALPLEQIKQFRQWGSMTPGHPERGLTPGVETTTGPLGQGFGNGVGMAMAEAHLAARYNRPGFKIVDHHTYGIVSDGDLMEGIASEAASLAGHLQLGKLIYLYDNNHVTLSAGTAITFTEDCARRFEAYGWHTQAVEDGNDLAAIEHALRSARARNAATVPDSAAHPSRLRLAAQAGHVRSARLAAGRGRSAVDEGEPGLADGAAVLHSGAGARAFSRRRSSEASGPRQSGTTNFPRMRKPFPNSPGNCDSSCAANCLPAGMRIFPGFPADAKGMATRVASGKIMNAIAPRLPALIGGSADLDPSTYTALKGLGDFEPSGAAAGDKQGSDGGGWSYAGRNLHFGVREHAMGSIMNGLAAHGGTVPFGATFLVFSDYMRPPIRLAALMGLHVIYVFTHDSIALGEDGSTHQPVEQLASLRAIPRLIVIRPGDANETAVAWRVALETRDRPVALVLTRQDVPTLDRAQFSAADGLRRGAYILADAPNGNPDLILIASGSEVALIVEARQKLLEKKIQVRIVSMPSWELFEAQPREYRDTVLPPAVGARLAVEAGVSQGWHRYVGSRGDVLAVDRFGASAPGEVVMREYGFTVDNVCGRAVALLE